MTNAVNHDQAIKTLLDQLKEFPGYDDRYVIYSEDKNLMIGAGFKPGSTNGIYTVISPDGKREYPMWVMPKLTVAALLNYMNSFIADLQKRMKMHGKL